MPYRDFEALGQAVDELKAAVAALSASGNTGAVAALTARLDKIVKNQTTLNQEHADRIATLEAMFAGLAKPAPENENPDA